MTLAQFEIGDFVRVDSDDSVTGLPVTSIVGCEGRIVRRGAAAAIGNGVPRTLFKVRLQDGSDGGRALLIPEDVLVLTDEPMLRAAAG